ncbi:hypothetical protein EMCRGX_G012846 [Ephydatia muelleri]
MVGLGTRLRTNTNSSPQKRKTKYRTSVWSGYEATLGQSRDLHFKMFWGSCTCSVPVLQRPIPHRYTHLAL